MSAPILSLPKSARTRVISRVLDRLASEYETHELAQLTGKSAFRILIGGILSARTKDTQTAPVCKALFALAEDARAMRKITETQLKKIIRPIGFYNQKARALRETCRMLLEKHGGIVPGTREELMEFPGVGRKVANLVLSTAFGQPAICVDTHVHRISNRLGWVETDDVFDTETALSEILPLSRHATINRAFVRHGQECCHPVSPRCSVCPVAKACAKVGVTRSR